MADNEFERRAGRVVGAIIGDVIFFGGLFGVTILSYNFLAFVVKSALKNELIKKFYARNTSSENLENDIDLDENLYHGYIDLE